jgi:hypothetical protein
MHTVIVLASSISNTGTSAARNPGSPKKIVLRIHTGRTEKASVGASR